MVFAINPPNTPIADRNGYVSPEWYRWFVKVQGVLGEDAVAAMQAAPVLTYSPTAAFSADKVLTQGSGLSFTSAATTLTVALSTTGVTAASYGSASQVGTFTVDAFGRLSVAANVTITPAAIGAVPTSRNLTAGAGLTGGGDLTLDRTFDVGAGTGITVNANDVALDTTNTRNVDHAAVTFTAGAGLTGGGTLEANRTFDVGAGTGITVNANDVALDTTSTRNTDHAAVTLTAGGGLTGGGDITANRTFAVGAGTGITVNADDVAIDTTVVATLTGAQTLTNKTLTLPIITTTTVAGLPAAGTAGRKSFVTDANATTFASVVAGGGANGVPVYDDGVSWRIG